MKKRKRMFFRSFLLSSVIIFCILIASFGIAAAYENTLRIGFGEYKKAVSADNDGIRILDFEFKF